MSKMGEKKYGLVVQICTILVLWLNGYVEAAAKSYTTDKVQHYMIFSAAGGISKQMYGKDTAYLTLPMGAYGLIGGGARVGVGYEVGIGAWFVGIGAEGRWQMVHDTIADFVDARPCSLDKNGSPMVSYEYVYSQMKGKTQIGAISIPIYIGYDMGEWAYVKVGASVSIPLWAQYEVNTRMYTQGRYDWSWQSSPIRSNRETNTDFEQSLNYYFEEEYSGKVGYTEALKIGAEGEVGAYIPSGEKGRMRIGLYIAADFSIGGSVGKAVVDYSAVNENPQTRTKAQLSEQLQFAPMRQSNVFRAMPPVMEVGVRMSYMLKVGSGKKKYDCMCIY